MDRIYRTLRIDQAEIHLLKLKPASSLNDGVVCSLALSSLQVRPGYEALSYCWGDTEVTRSILLDGVERQVTVNLEIALRYLRHPSEVRVL